MNRWKYGRPALWAVMLMTVPYLIVVLHLWHRVPIHDGEPIGPADPDSWLRLTLVREWLQGGGWYNHTVLNSNTPFAAPSSPWTRPLDLVIAAFTKLQPATVELNIRLARAALLLPVLWMSLLLMGIHRLVRFFMPTNPSYLMASLIATSIPMMWTYFGIGNADHHAPLACCFIWALGCVFAPRQTPWLMVLSGLLFALQLWISVEALILILAVYLWFGLFWLRGERSIAAPLCWLTSTIALASAAAVMIERAPSTWFTPMYDSISIVYVFVFTLAALYAWALRLIDPQTLRGRIAFSLIGSVIVLGLIHRIYPMVFKGPLAGVDPYIFSDFLPHISEAQPLTHLSPIKFIALLLQPAAAIALCLLAWWRPRASFYSKAQALPLLYFIVLGTALYIGQVRWCYYLYPIVAVAFGPVLGALLSPHADAIRWPARWMLSKSETAQAARRIPIILACIFLPLLLGSLTPYYERTINGNVESELSRRTHACQHASRQVIYSGALAKLGPKPLNIFASTNNGAEILFFTPYRIVASNYHREGPGIRYVWEAYAIDDRDELRDYLKQRRIDALFLCPIPEPEDGSILQGLASGDKAPSWLKPVSLALPPAADRAATIDHANPVLFLVRH